MQKLVGKTALISGGASGIGKAAACMFAQEGAQVLIADCNSVGAAQLSHEIAESGGVARPFPLNVTDESEWQKAVSTAVDTWGHLDILVASAGISFAKPIVETSLEEWRRVMAVNLDGVFLGAKHAARVMRADRGGSIAFVSSASGIKVAGGASAYCASKAAVNMFAKTLALEMSAHAPYVRVNTVLPGAVQTQLWHQMDFFRDLVRQYGSEEAAWREWGKTLPFGRAAQPEDVARLLLFLASDDSSYMTGAEIAVDGGYSA
jgi:3(or 17)beta-hydroxysteroid dehydrogenase